MMMKGTMMVMFTIMIMMIVIVMVMTTFDIISLLLFQVDVPRIFVPDLQKKSELR